MRNTAIFLGLRLSDSQNFGLGPKSW